MNELFLKLEADWKTHIPIYVAPHISKLSGVYSNLSKQIHVGFNSPGPHRTLAHELGHYIDEQVKPNSYFLYSIDPNYRLAVEQNADFYGLLLAHEYGFFEEYVHFSIKEYENWGQLKEAKNLNECADFLRNEFNLEATKKAA